MLRGIILILICCSLPLRANLGETIADCVKRYGKPSGYSEATDKNPFGILVFESHGYALLIFVLDGKEVGARISKVDKSDLSEADQQTIMASDEGGSHWTSVSSDDPTTLQWRRDDKSTVLYDREKHMLIFTSPEMSRGLHPSVKPAAAL